ncbi:hypothetical protein CAAU_1388 [Caloramator australicus RC3]|uniref:Uncharacterized protein n=1 Tax=Caloramator australicus RC3 TaxID=857293 RepID=I7LJ67_9CLOT|nr:hypothetical protein CAAU_1388 [Caloramator australicus RC3]
MNSFYFSIWETGLNLQSIKILKSGVNANRNEFKIIAAETKNKNIK